MKKILILTVFSLFCALSFAQESGSTLTMLTLPTSAHVTALGGENVSSADAQPSVVLHNPALLSNLDSNLLGLQFMTYADGTKWMGAEYSRAIGERHTGAVFGHYLGYGSMDETDEHGNIIGDFSPKDIVVGVGYSYLLSDHWAGGANFKMGYSHIAEYSSLAIGVDLGLNYLDVEKDFSASVVMRNIGAQVKTFDGVVERVPFNLQAGFTKGLAHLPVEFNVTLIDLTRWKKSDYYVPDAEKLKFGRLALNHVVFGVEIKPTNYLYIAGGYNFRRAYELKAAGSSHMAGLSLGAGLNLSKFKFGISWAKYHHSTSSIMGNVAYSF
ncbi:MAG: type IX secretion system protein PorQ [Bacteroidales bacterium]|nr:type IX secretion system protein PorQ [Bacteroidales bacterium]